MQSWSRFNLGRVTIPGPCSEHLDQSRFVLAFCNLRARQREQYVCQKNVRKPQVPLHVIFICLIPLRRLKVLTANIHYFSRNSKNGGLDRGP